VTEESNSIAFEKKSGERICKKEEVGNKILKKTMIWKKRINQTCY